MEKYTLSSYEEALKSYDQNAENLKKRHSNEIDELTKENSVMRVISFYRQEKKIVY